MDKLDKTGTLPKVIQDGKINKDALIQGLGGLLNKNQPPAVQPEAAPTPATTPASQQAMPTAPEVQADSETTTGTDDSTAAATKITKKKKKSDAGEVGRQLLQDFLGGQ